MIYITGANGWLGLNLIKSILEKKTEKWGLKKDKITAFILNNTSREKLQKISSDINIIEGDLKNNSDLNTFLSSSKNNILFHTAGIIHPESIKEFNLVNFQGTLNLLKAAVRFSIKKVVILSSNSPIGCNPNRQHRFNEESPYNPYMNYGKSKMEMEKIVNKFSYLGLLNTVIIRAPWFYGPFQPNRQKIFFKMIQNGKVPIIGDGECMRSMVFMDNLIQGLIRAATKEISNGKIYWIADEEPYSMNKIINTIQNVLEVEYNLICSNKRIRLPNLVGQIAEKIDYILQFIGIYNQKVHVLSEMNKNIACDISLAKKELGYEPEFSLKSGIKKALNEFV